MEYEIKTNESDSDLIMKDIYFSSIDFKQRKNIYNLGRLSFNVVYNVEIRNLINETSDKEIVVEVLITEEQHRVDIKLVANGIFNLLNNNYSKEDEDYLFKYNALSIMFPFIRSQVSTITAQPGLSPLLLRPINLEKLWNNKNK